ncbi:hypothetical protein Tco_0007195 [Tanacetum coccineum]
MFVSAGSSSSVSADYVPAGHVLISADRYRWRRRKINGSSSPDLIYEIEIMYKFESRALVKRSSPSRFHGLRCFAVVMVEMGEGAARGEEWSRGSERSGDGARFWCWPKNPAGKDFRRRVVVVVAGGWWSMRGEWREK